MPSLGHGAVVRLDVLEAALAILAGRNSAIQDVLQDAVSDETNALTFSLTEDLQDFGFMFPHLQADPNNLLPVSPSTQANLIALGVTMHDPFNAGPEPNPGDSVIPAAYTYLGQFIDHDVTLETFSAAAPDLFLPGLTPLAPIVIENMIRNLRTGTLDLDSVYGPPAPPDPLDSEKLMVGVVAEFDPTNPTFSVEPFLRPIGKDDANDLPRTPRHVILAHDRAALIGDPRNDENLIVAQLHLAFLRAHNALISGGMSGPEAQKTLRQHYQFMVVDDFLKTIADPAVVDAILEHGSPTLANGAPLFAPATEGSTDPYFMPLEYAAAAFRFGHTMIRGGYNFNRNFNFSGAPGTLGASLGLLFSFSALSGSLGDFETLPENWIIEWERMLDLGFGAPFDRARRVDTKLVEPLFHLTNIEGIEEPVNIRSLAVRNLVRGYLLRLPTGQAVATALGITPLTPLELQQAAASPAQAQALTAGGFLNRTPLWYYILAEASSNTIHGGLGQRLGRVGSTIVASVLIAGARRSVDSFLTDASWNGPTLPSVRPGTFTLTDLLQLAGVLVVTCSHTVKTGDSLSKIAKRFYGDEDDWPRIFDANQHQITDPDVIFPGQVLRVPVKARHKVKAGESLSVIAGEFYGDVNEWPRIFSANQHQISDPDLIFPGLVLCIP